MTAPPDAAARARALNVTRSFIVQAPAGSGKTELLTQRYLRLLSGVERPEEVVALTFTRKAAGEMRARVLDALELARAAEPPVEAYRHTTWQLGREVLQQDVRQGWRLADQPVRLRILTLDALNALIARQMPYLSGAGADLVIAANAQDLYVHAARRVLQRIDAEPSQAAPVAQLLRQLDNRFAVAERLLADLLAKRDHWLHLITGRADVARAHLEAGLQHLLRDRLAALRAALPAGQAAELMELAATAAANLAERGSPSPIVACRELRTLPGNGTESLAIWCGIAELLLNHKDRWRQSVNVIQGFPPERRQDKQRLRDLIVSLVDSEELRRQLAVCRRLPPARYTEDQWSVLSALVSVLPLAAAELELLFRERGEVDFIAQSRAALDALGNDLAPSDLALALDYRIGHLLVDEFQDTSRSQLDLLVRLTAGWQDGDGRTLFVVGDPTQSIYGFREADVGLFLAAKRSGVGDVRLELLSLTANFRSQQRLVTWVNEVFGALLPAADELANGAVAHVRGSACLPAIEGDAVSVHASLAGHPPAEAETVIRLVQAARSEDPTQRIAILVRSRSHLADIAPRLSAAGLRFQAVEIEHLGHRPAVGDLLALTRALLHFADRSAWLAVLRAPWCGLTLADLHALVTQAPDTTVWDCMRERAGQLSADGAARLHRTRSILQEHLSRRGRCDLRDWVEQAWIALGGPATLEERSDLANAETWFELLQKLDQAGDLPDVAQLEAFLEDLYAAPDTRADASLQLMTIHKAKGLEFDTVILPGLDKLPRRNEKPLLHWIEIARGPGPADLLLAPIGPRGGEADPLHACIAAMKLERERLEAQRLLYVAVTRAGRRVHLLGCVRLRQTGQVPVLSAPRAGSFLHGLWAELAPVFEQQTARMPLPPPPRWGGGLRAHGIRRLVAGWEQPAPVDPVATVIGEMTDALPEPPPYDWAGEPARRIGTVVHRALQRIAEEGAEAWGDARVTAFGPVVNAQLRAAGLPANALAEATQRVLDALRLTLADERGRWILGSERSDARCEYAVTGLHGRHLVNAVIDRSFVDNDGVRWVVDYKSSRHEGGALEIFLASELARYAAKLELYATLLRQLDDRPVRAGLYFPLLAEWREWPGKWGHS